MLGVVDAADDDRLVGIAFQEIDDHLLADARNVDRAPLLAGPGRADAHPAGAVGVVLALAVPVELHFHAAVLVGEDLFAARADHDRRLRVPDDARASGVAAGAGTGSARGNARERGCWYSYRMIELR